MENLLRVLVVQRKAVEQKLRRARSALGDSDEKPNSNIRSRCFLKVYLDNVKRYGEEYQHIQSQIYELPLSDNQRFEHTEAHYEFGSLYNETANTLSMLMEYATRAAEKEPSHGAVTNSVEPNLDPVPEAPATSDEPSEQWTTSTKSGVTESLDESNQEIDKNPTTTHAATKNGEEKTLVNTTSVPESGEICVADTPAETMESPRANATCAAKPCMNLTAVGPVDGLCDTLPVGQALQKSENLVSWRIVHAIDTFKTVGETNDDIVGSCRMLNVTERFDYGDYATALDKPMATRTIRDRLMEPFDALNGHVPRQKIMTDLILDNHGMLKNAMPRRTNQGVIASDGSVVARRLCQVVDVESLIERLNGFNKNSSHTIPMVTEGEQEAPQTGWSVGEHQMYRRCGERDERNKVTARRDGVL